MKIVTPTLVCALSVLPMAGWAATDPVFEVITTNTPGWRATDMRDVRIRAGSALDLSAVGGGAPTLPEAGGAEERWLGFVAGHWQLIPLLTRDCAKAGADWKRVLDEYAAQVRRQGFNCYRMHGLLDSDYNPFVANDSGCPTESEMDRYDYLASALAKNGVRLYADVVAYGMRWRTKPVRKNIDLKAGTLFGVPKYVAAWEQCVREILNHVNPYTGRAWKDDPNLVGVCEFNEQMTGAKIALEGAWRGLDPETKDFFIENWKRWMVEKGYAKSEDVAKYTKNTPTLPGFYGKDPHGRRLHQYVSELAIERCRWYDSILDDIGYKGLRGAFNSNVDFGGCAARWMAGNMVPYNIHAGHPLGGGAGGVGSRVPHVDELYEMTMKGSGFCYGNRIKLADRPYVVTEYSHAFWNRDRRDAGIVCPALGALNGWKGILWHSGGTQLEVMDGWPRGRITTFEVATSPCMRACQFLSSCLFLRGDVRESKKRVYVSVPEAYWREHTADAPSSSQARIGLLCNYALEFPDLPRPTGVKDYTKPDLRLAPGTGDEIEDGLWVSNVKSKNLAAFDMDAFAAKLRTKGILPSGNQTDPKNGVYESETGEIYVEGTNRYMQVVTPKTEAVTMRAGRRAKLDRLEVKSLDVDALLALTTVDGRTLADSKRMVFLFVTQEANSGIRTSADGRTLIQPGAYPALLRTGRVEVSLSVHLELATKLRLHMLGYSGERLEEIPVRLVDGRLHWTIDTAATKTSPTPFFELVCD